MPSLEEIMAGAIVIDVLEGKGWVGTQKGVNKILQGINIIRQISYEDSIRREAKEEPTATTAVAEIKKETLTTSYLTIVKRTVPKGKTLYVSKVEMYCDNYDTTQWEFYVNSVLVELEDNTKWTGIYLPVALTMTFDGSLEVQGGKYIEVKAKDSALGDAWGDITGVIR